MYHEHTSNILPGYVLCPQQLFAWPDKSGRMHVSLYLYPPFGSNAVSFRPEVLMGGMTLRLHFKFPPFCSNHELHRNSLVHSGYETAPGDRMNEHAGARMFHRQMQTAAKVKTESTAIETISDYVLPIQVEQDLINPANSCVFLTMPSATDSNMIHGFLHVEMLGAAQVSMFENRSGHDHHYIPPRRSAVARTNIHHAMRQDEDEDEVEWQQAPTSTVARRYHSDNDDRECSQPRKRSHQDLVQTITHEDDKDRNL